MTEHTPPERAGDTTTKAWHSLHWALDMIEMYDKRLASMDGEVRVHTPVHVAAKRAAWAVLEALRQHLAAPPAVSPPREKHEHRWVTDGIHETQCSICGEPALPPREADGVSEAMVDAAVEQMFRHISLHETMSVLHSPTLRAEAREVIAAALHARREATTEQCACGGAWRDGECSRCGNHCGPSPASEGAAPTSDATRTELGDRVHSLEETNGLQFRRIQELESDLELLRKHCRIIFFPRSHDYPIEHSLESGKDQWQTLFYHLHN